ncbi:putative beta-1,4-xylosyltransferase IRX9 [Vitis vinifera]|uniref:Glycosyltransferases n=1 Tax=Vitis vinifera TaxID=29760 RepID=A0A438DWE3_VITVI|nr:putative beta-1,4-xylosyltransferase IRX9 [Vitis vinifera]
MGSSERSKKRVQLWKKAVVQFSLCFVMGFFMGFAPAVEMLHLSMTPNDGNGNRTLMAETPVEVPARSREVETAESLQEGEDEPKLVPGRLLIIVTPAVEAQTDSSEVSEILRKTGIMYRHLVSKENFTEPAAEMDHQRNLALSHIEHHKLSGIVHFAALSNVYDLRFFDEIRDIEVFGTWPMASLSANRNKVIMEGPVCDSSQVIGWHLKKMNNETETRSPLHISGFSFNSSILWDPERWGRPSSVQDNSQNSIKFVKEVALEDESKLKGIPQEDCSRILLWNLHIPVGTIPRYHQRLTPLDDSRR